MGVEVAVLLLVDGNVHLRIHVGDAVQEDDAGPGIAQVAGVEIGVPEGPDGIVHHSPVPDVPVVVIGDEGPAVPLFIHPSTGTRSRW